MNVQTYKTGNAAWDEAMVWWRTQSPILQATIRSAAVRHIQNTWGEVEEIGTSDMNAAVAELYSDYVAAGGGSVIDFVMSILQ